MQNGSLVEYLRGIREGRRVKEVDALRMMHEVARGMEYLHGMGVLHGDLKV